MQVNETTKGTEYQGAVMAVANALKDLPCGGQILMEHKTFDVVKTHLAELFDRLPRKPDMDALEMNCR